MRLLLVGPLPPPIGGATVLFKLLVDEMTTGAMDADITVVNFSAGTRRGVAKKLVATMTSMLRICKAIPRQNIVVVNGPNRRLVYQGLLVSLLTRLFRKPLVLRFFGGSFDHYYQQASPRHKKLIRHLFSQAACILLETQHLLDYFRGQGFPDLKERFVQFANSRPVNLHVRTAPLRAGPARRFVFVGHVKPSKGVLTVLKASAFLRPGSCTIDIYGPFDDGMSVDDFTPYEKVTYQYTLPPEEVIPTLSRYDVLLLPSYWQGEGHPGSILEAYMAGLPVIASAWRSIPEVVHHGINGLLVPPRDPQALAEAMQRLIDNPELFNALRHGVRKESLLFASATWNRQVLPQICKKILRSEHIEPDFGMRMARRFPDAESSP